MWYIIALVAGFIGGSIFMTLFSRRNNDTVTKINKAIDVVSGSETTTK